MNGHIQQEQRRRRLDAQVRLVVMAREVLYVPENRGIRRVFTEAVRVSFADGVTPNQISKLTGWSQAAIRKELGHDLG